MSNDHCTIRSLREELGLSQEAFAARVGVQSKGYMSRIERGEPCSVKVAVEIERLSGGRIDAAELNEDVRLARHGLPSSEAEAQDHVG